MYCKTRLIFRLLYRVCGSVCVRECVCVCVSVHNANYVPLKIKSPFFCCPIVYRVLYCSKMAEENSVIHWATEQKQLEELRCKTDTRIYNMNRHCAELPHYIIYVYTWCTALVEKIGGCFSVCK